MVMGGAVVVSSDIAGVGDLGKASVATASAVAACSVDSSGSGMVESSR